MLDSHSLEERGFVGGGGGGGGGGEDWGTGEGVGGAGGGGEGRRKEAEEETGLKGLEEGGRWGAGEEAARNCMSMAAWDFRMPREDDGGG